MRDLARPRVGLGAAPPPAPPPDVRGRSPRALRLAPRARRAPRRARRALPHPPATRLAALALALAHVVATAVDPERAATLALRAGGVVQAPWTIATCSWLETNPASFLPNLVLLVVLGRAVEPSLGRGLPFARFLIFASVFVGVFAFAVALVRFAATKDESILYADHRGAQGIVGALCLALRQAMPDAPINVRGLRWAKCRALPAAHCFFWAAVAVVAQDATAFVLAFAGAYGGWVYARYLHPRPDGSGVGDDGEHLACAGFFPPAFSALVAPLFESIHRVCCGARERRLAGRSARRGAAPGPRAGATRRAKGRRGRGDHGRRRGGAARRERGARRSPRGWRRRGGRANAAPPRAGRRRRRTRGAREAAEAKDARGREDASAEKGGSAGEGNAGEGGGSDEAV